MVLVLTFAALVGLRLVVLFGAAALLVRPVRSCPACFRPTIPILCRWIRRLAPWYELRWCPSCRWQGVARRTGTRIEAT